MDNTESIKDLIKNIDKKNVTLPEFQRDFVWGIERTLDLFDSLAKNIFIGAIIYGKPSFEITVREIDNRPRKGPGSRRKLENLFISVDDAKKKSEINNFRLILDGQQRITSIYRALKGIDDVWLILKNNDELSDDIIEINEEQRSLEQTLYEFSGTEDSERLSIRLANVFEMTNRAYREKQIKTEFFDKLKYPKQFGAEEEEILFNKYLIYRDKLDDLLKNNKLFNYYMLDMSLSKFALFFERSNSRGIQLDFIDILSAKLYIGFKLRDKIEEFESNNPQHKPFLTQSIVRAVSYIKSGGKDLAKDYILKRLNHADFNEHWDSLIESYKNTLDFLFDNKYIVSQSWLPYENMLIPLLLFVREFKNDWSSISESQAQFIKYWYWASIFSTRYSGASNDVIVQDTNALLKIARNEKIKSIDFFKKISRFQVTSPEDLYSFNKKRSAVYKGLLNFIHFDTDGYVGWQNSNKISLNSKLEDHHVFPRAYIDKQYVSDDRAVSLRDCVVNRTLIPKLLNIKIGKKTPSIYLNEIKANFNENIENALVYHKLPTELLSGLYDEFFLDFIEERSKLIFSAIQDEIYNLKDEMIEQFHEPEIKITSSIKIFRTYLGHDFIASFNPSSKKIMYNKQEFSVSGAAEKAKAEAKGIEVTDITANGWTFWKYTDNIGVERYIDELRQST